MSGSVGHFTSLHQLRTYRVGQIHELLEAGQLFFPSFQTNMLGSSPWIPLPRFQSSGPGEDRRGVLLPRLQEGMRV